MYKIALELTKNCNLQCEYCYQTHLRENMDIKIAKNAIEIGVSNAISLRMDKVLISFFGGEPLLRFSEILELTKYAQLLAANKDLDLSFEITTNGTLLRSDILDFFADNQFYLKISLDGTPYYHDLNRLTSDGKGSYELIARNFDSIISYQKRLKMPVQISMVITQNNYKDLFLNIKHLLTLGFRMFDTALNSEDNWTISELSELKKELGKVVDYYFERAKIGKGFAWTFIDNGIIPQMKKRKNYFCGAGVTSIFVNTAGEIFPCFACFQNEALIGSLDMGFFEEKLERFKKYKRNLNRQCTQCEINSYCAACDCLMVNLEHSGDYYTVPMMFCELAKLRYELTNKLFLNTEWNEILEKAKVRN
ncbi:radical SAM/SPASM domain-containing protein [Paenibacillus durus]|uniref:Radical SAM core domain-containing protein n=1 Tax=Paenibacillus durus TaxID=44251 RepID=A0A089IPM1_PAEDU|nr:radical SAM protein [Paenibacillus durus]AIQ11004.1 hypothetical protein PDUR_02505 [Paenibacillus durus]